MASQARRTLQGVSWRELIAASTCDKHSVGPLIRPICTRFCVAMTNMIQVCSNFYWARVLIINAREILALSHTIWSMTNVTQMCSNVCQARVFRSTRPDESRGEVDPWDP